MTGVEERTVQIVMPQATVESEVGEGRDHGCSIEYMERDPVGCLEDILEV